MRTDWARIIGWAIPLACIALAAYLIFHERSAFLTAGQDLQKAQLMETAASLAKDKAEKESGTMRVAAVTPSTTEEPKFLAGLRTRAAETGIQITKWASQAPAAASAAPAAGSSDPNAPKDVDPAVKSLTKLQSDLTLLGPYQGIRDFLFYIGHRNRLYLFSNMRWNLKSTGGNVELTTTITRYVDPTLPKEGEDIKSIKKT